MEASSCSRSTYATIRGEIFALFWAFGKFWPALYDQGDMKDVEFTSVVYKEGKYFVSQCLDVDVASFGKTKKLALKNLGEALDLYFADRPLKRPTVQRAEIQILAVAHA